MPAPKAKGKDTVTYSAQNNVVEHIVEGSIASSSTVVFGNCHVGFLICRSCLEAHSSVSFPSVLLYFLVQNCKYTLSAFCTKLFIQGCTNLTIELNAKVLTSTVEVYKCANVNIEFKTKCGTLQLDMCRDIDVKFHEESHFYNEGQVPLPKDTPAAATASLEETRNTAMIVWSATQKKKKGQRRSMDDNGETKTDDIISKNQGRTEVGSLLTGQCFVFVFFPFFVLRAGCHNLNVGVLDTKKSFSTSFDAMKQEFHDLVEERSQFRLKLDRSSAGEVKFVQERVCPPSNNKKKMK